MMMIPKMVIVGSHRSKARLKHHNTVVIEIFNLRQQILSPILYLNVLKLFM